MAETYEIEIVNWEKYNPRNDIKKPSWFSFHNDFFMHDVLSNLSPQEVIIWLFILCERSRQQKKFIKVSEESVKRFCKVYAKFLHSLVKVLKSEGIVKIKTTSESDGLDEKSVRARNATLQDTTLQNNNTPVVPLKRGHRKNRKSEARKMVAAIVGALRKDGLNEDAAKNTILEKVGDIAWKILSVKYPKWEQFCRSYQHENRLGKSSFLEKDLIQMFEAFLEVPLEIQPLHLVKESE